MKVSCLFNRKGAFVFTAYMYAFHVSSSLNTLHVGTSGNANTDTAAWSIPCTKVLSSGANLQLIGNTNRMWARKLVFFFDTWGKSKRRAKLLKAAGVVVCQNQLPCQLATFAVC
eukprot:2201412-Amphidinium_carterae.1